MQYLRGYGLPLALALLTAVLITFPPNHSDSSPYQITSPPLATARVGRGAITSIDLSVDDQYLVVGTDIGVFVYDALSFELLWYHLTDSPVMAVQFVADTHRFAAAIPALDQLIFFDAAANEVLDTFKMPSLLPSGQLGLSLTGILVTSEEHGLRLWDALTLQEIARHYVEGHPVSISPNGELVIVRSPGLYNIYDVESWQVVDQIRAENAHAFYWLDGETLWWSHAQLYQPRTRTTEKLSGIVGVAPYTISPDRQWITTAHSLWHIQTNQEIRIEGHAAGVQFVEWFSDSRTFITANEGEVFATDIITGQRLRAIDGHMDAVFGLDWSPDGSTLALGLRDSRIILLNVATGDVFFQADADYHIVSDVAFRPDGTQLVGSGDWLSVITLSEAAITHYWTSDDFILTVDWSPDGNKLVTGELDGVVQVWNGETGRITHQSHDPGVPFSYENPENDHLDRVGNVAWSPDGSMIASADSRRLIIWNDSLEAINTIDTLPDYGFAINFAYRSLDWSPDSTRLITIAEKRFMVWNASTGQIETEWMGDTRVSYTAVAWSPFGDLLAAGDFDGDITFFDPISGDILQKVGSHNRSISTLAWSPDGKMIASGSWDGTVILWDVAALLQADR
jgi:WD40 repeat protein